MTKRTLVTCEALFLLIVEAGAPRAAAQESANPLPAFADLKDGWNTLTPGGDTSCTVDPNYRFFCPACCTGIESWCSLRAAARASTRGVVSLVPVTKISRGAMKFALIPSRTRVGGRRTRERSRH